MFRRAVVFVAVGAILILTPLFVFAQSAVERNSNVVGRTMPGFYRGIPAMQDNEASCAINPLLPRNIVCAWNASGGSDDLIGDTWLRFSESLDGGRTFYNRYLNGSNLDPATSVGQQFGADPVMMCWPGGCGTVMLASTRAETGGEGGGIYIQWMADVNTETGFRKAFKVELDQVYNSTGSHFADKPHALYMLDEDDPGTVDVTFDVEMPDGSTQSLTRSWPKARILVAFALFNPSKNDIEILSTYTDDYGASWNNAKQVAVTSGRDQGISIAAIGDTVFYGYRRFANGGDSNAIMGAVSTNQGQRIGKPFVIEEDLCVYDVPTLPSSADSTAAAARTNDFPWVSQDGSRFVMVYSKRRLSSIGDGCLTDPNAPSDSRIVAIVGSANGRTWTEPEEVAPNTDHGFQFMPVVDCSLGVCQVAWWDSRRDSARVRDYLLARDQQAVLDYFESVPILADFHLPFDPLVSNDGYTFRRTADMYTKKITLLSDGIDNSDAATRASRYRLGLYEGQVVEREFNPFNVKAYKTNTVPFMSDYSSLTSVRHRYVFDPDDLSQPPFWESNASENSLNPEEAPLFWLSWTDARNMRGQIYTYAIDGQLPYSRPMTLQSKRATDDNEAGIEGPESVTAESVEDFNPAPGVCTPSLTQPGAGETFLALNNRVKDSDIYGALIENRATAWSLNPTKTLGLIQRTYVLVAENENSDPLGKIFRFEIANQPTGYEDSPRTARASWKQLPYDLDDPDFQTVEPTTEVLEAVGPQSSVSVALFLVSDESVNPVTVNIYDTSTVPETLVNSIVVNGAVEAGPLLNADGTPNEEEIHNPLVYPPNTFNFDHYDETNPDQFNPDQYNPDQFNPDLFNPDQYNPDQFNPDQFNPDQFNPDQYNPDQFNPDQFNPDLFNPDQFNPDQFNPDQFNPDQFNLALSDSDELHNPEIPSPNITDAIRNPDGTVTKVDVNFGIQNVGNTLTPYTVDFAISDAEVLALITSGQITTQLIAWQNKQIDDELFCEPRLVTENRIIAAENDPDLTQLTIPTIQDNRAGSLTYFIVPGDILQNTIRFIGPDDLIEFVEGRLRDDIISYVFTAQTANTGQDELQDEREQIINDRTPATFNFVTGTTSVLEANAPGGAILPFDFVTASKNDIDVPVTCTPALGAATVSLDILNGDAPTALNCTATTDNGVTAELDMTISVVDTEAPIIDPTSVPSDQTLEAASSSGAVATFDLPVATDVFGVDDVVDVECTPASDSLFPFDAPGPTLTDVSCVATDDSGNESDPEVFTITVEDTSPPEFDDDLVFDPPSPPPDYELDADSSTFLLTWGPFSVDDADAAPDVSCNPGTLDPGILPPQYRFSHEFPVGSTTVVCTATDSNGLIATISFPVVIYDLIPPVITLSGDQTVTIEQGSGDYVDAGATAVDNNDPNVAVTIDIDSSAVDTTTAGTYTVTITATDPSGNSSTATRTVIVEFAYGLTGIIATKTNAKVGSSNPLYWAWLDADGNAVNTSGDAQMLTIQNCETGEILINPVGDPGASGFRLKADNWWQYNWDSMGEKQVTYCASVESGLTGQMQYSPEITLR
ncbi:MAG: DUF5011 domain-containing protein [Gammaproteobacteria bacterium]|nr:DUF5011 domain-containing protein [Gammaproteobacteria bacterium]